MRYHVLFRAGRDGRHNAAPPTAQEFNQSPRLANVADRLSDTAGAPPTSVAAIPTVAPVSVPTTAPDLRVGSRAESEWGDRAPAAMRRQFVGHGRRPYAAGPQ